MIIDVDDSLSSHADNHKSFSSVLGEGSIDNINGYVGSAEKKFSMNFSEVKIEFCFSLSYNSHNIFFFVNGKEINKFKANNKNFNVPTQFCQGSISEKFCC